ncbi:aldo/keto reductase [Sphingomonas canadensis]|uniref:Aldo/keto reductase n=1 Tax=Sphingomonas canadensis TaxID=1219257 RepID=A0ABW3H3C9_9SPHN|nr:aldo/keto reductase [Sphingomonas canadensis]MCW3835650.1 aldo/keto reductase [Sphingomonas canadensis]
MTMLPTRTIGPFTVSAIGLGCMNLSHAYDVAPSAEDGARLLNHALDSGVTLLDTAALYGSGNNERLLAQAVMHRRGEFTLASKCVLDLIDGQRVLDGRPETISASLDRSLQRLGTDHIDLYYMHRLDRKVPIEDSMGALVRAKEAGKIGAIGLSEMGAASIRRAHAVHPVAAVQNEYSPTSRNVEIAVMDACRELGIALVAFSPLARGLLAGSVRSDDYRDGDIRKAMPRFNGANLAHNLNAVDRFVALAGETGCTPAQLVLAWVLSRGPNVVPIPGTRSIAHLDDDLGALKVTITPELTAAIDAIFAPGAIRGARYPALQQTQIDTETFPDEELA